MKRSKIILILLLVLAFFSFFYWGLDQYFQFEYIKSNQEKFQNFYESNFILTLTTYFLIYVLSVALNIPVAAALTLLAGALFGLFVGTIVVSFASALGATLGFLLSRLLLRDWVEKKFSKYVDKINKGFEKEGAYYLFTLRLIPAIPFFIINIVFGLTKMRPLVFFFVSQIGMLAGTLVYVNAGTQIGELNSYSGLLSPKLILSFVLLGLFPLIIKKIFKWVGQSEKV